MYVEYFELNKRPFPHVPSANQCVMVHSIMESLRRCRQCIDESSGPILVIGAAGCGKSTLLALIESTYREQLSVVMLNCATICDRQELIQCLMYQLGQPFQSASVGELRLQMMDHLKSAEHCPHGLLLLVDEAHGLSYDVLEELRMITNLVCGNQQQVRLVIAGGRSLEEKLAHPQLDSFNQRIAVRCYLQRMTRDETIFYILDQIRQCGRDGRELFHPSTLQKIYDITDGIPRLVSQLGRAALRLACTDNQSAVSAQLVQRAWCELQQLPMPESDVATTGVGTTDNIIEFGELDENAQTPESKVDHAHFSQPTAFTEGEPTAENTKAPTAESTFVPDQSHIIAEAFSQTNDSNDLHQEQPIPHETEPAIEPTSELVDEQRVEQQLNDLLKQIESIQQSATEPADFSIEAENVAENSSIAANEDDWEPESTATFAESTPTSAELFGNDFVDEEPVIEKHPMSATEESQSSRHLNPQDVENLRPADEPLKPLAQIPKLVDSDSPKPSNTEQTNIGNESSDSEIMLVSQSEDDSDEPASNSGHEQQEKSDVGQVIRMDYRDLFEQLKNDPTTQND